MNSPWLDEVRTLLRGRQVDLDQVLAAMVDEIARHFDADRATFYLVDHASRELVSRAAHLPEISEIRLKLGEGIAGWVGQKGEAIRIGAHEEDPRWQQRIDASTGYSTQSMLCVPVRDGDFTIIGVLQLLNKRVDDFSDDDLDRFVEAAREVASLLDDSSLRGQLHPTNDKPLAFRFNFIVGESARIIGVYERVERAARTEATVLLRGETGTGKELFARAVHFNSPRRNGPLVKVDCAALPETLIENELFGHERGAYTGADRATDGKIASADGGTLFLDEIGELPLQVQGKLLRLLQDRTFMRVGGSEPRHVNVRFVCATHVDLERAVDEGRFRPDLYYRLRVVEIDVPPLRDRGHVDLDRLVDHFLYEFKRLHGRPSLVLSAEARASLHSWSWPGNVRELEHCIESAVVLAPGRTIERESLPIHRARRDHPSPDGRSGDAFVSDIRPLREVERAYCRHVVALCEDNRTKASQVLDIGRNTLARKLKDPGD